MSVRKKNLVCACVFLAVRFEHFAFHPIETCISMVTFVFGYDKGNDINQANMNSVRYWESKEINEVSSNKGHISTNRTAL